MTNLRHSVLLAMSLALASRVDGQPVPYNSLQPLAFLSGRWVSETPAEFQEENWTPVNGDSMTGSFRVVQHGSPVFYEFWVVELDAHRPVLKLRHFHSGFVGWEDKDSATRMPVTSAAENDVVFAEADGSVSLHYHLVANKLTCSVHHVRNGKSSDETFTLMRATVK